MVSQRTKFLQRDLSQPSRLPTQYEASSSSKDSSSVGTLKVDWQFLNSNHPAEAKTLRHRKRVRSHVTKQQHHRRKALTTVRRTDSYELEPVVGDLPQNISRVFFNHPSVAELSSGCTQPVPGHTDAKLPSSSPFPTMFDPQYRVEVNDLYSKWHSHIPQILERYLQNIALDIPNIEGPDKTGLLRTKFYPFVFADPASMHAVMLMAASHYGRGRDSKFHTVDLLQLRGIAISEINNALAENGRGTSDQLIAAVANMASYEASFGNHAICYTHMQGLVRMVSLRGGLPALGLGGLLERLILWIDSNTSHITGIRLHFDKVAFPPSSVSETHPLPDPTRAIPDELSQQQQPR